VQRPWGKSTAGENPMAKKKAKTKHLKKGKKLSATKSPAVNAYLRIE
jgi:hypothetical protein